MRLQLSRLGASGRLLTVIAFILANMKPLAHPSIVGHEDPYANPFTEAFAYAGRSFLILPGRVDESTFILDRLANAIDSCDGAGWREARELLLATLIIGDEIVRRSGLGRGVEPLGLEPDQRVVTIPSPEHLERLKHAVIFRPDEFASLLLGQGVAASALDPLTQPAGAVPLLAYRTDADPLLARPIVRTSDGYVVALPGMLPVAARHALLSLACRCGSMQDLAIYYHRAARDIVSLALDDVGSHPYGWMPFEPVVEACASDALFTLDTDKCIYALVITDPLDDYDPDTPRGVWALDATIAWAMERFRYMERVLYSAEGAPNDLLMLLLVQGVGRCSTLSVDETVLPGASALLVMDIADLQTLTSLERADPLALWWYARAVARVRHRAAVVAMSALDEFHLYRTHGYGHPVTGDPDRHVICAWPGGAGDLRRVVLRERDQHTVPGPSGTLVCVEARHDTRTIPIYTPPCALGDQAALFIEGLSVPLWILGDPVDEGSDPLAGLQLYTRALHFADAIAYWLLRCAPSLSGLLAHLGALQERIVVRLTLEPAAAWAVDQIAVDDPSADPVVVRACPHNGVAHATLHPTVSGLVSRPDNRGEIALVSAIIGGLRALLPDSERDAWSDARIWEALDRHAAPPIRKALSHLDGIIAPDLDARDLPPHRHVQGAAEREVFDELADYLRGRPDIRAGQVPDDRRIEVLDAVAAFHYRALEQLVAMLSPDGILEWLLAYHEALVQQDAHTRLIRAPFLACNDTTPDLVARFHAEERRHPLSAVAARFVIEYVAARPPCGYRPMSHAVYDRLQALAAAIVTVAVSRDLLRLGLGEVGLTILPSGYLLMQRSRFTAAMDLYTTALAEGVAARATEAYGRYWSVPADGAARSERTHRLDVAVDAELGYPLTDLLHLMSVIGAIGDDIDPVAPCLPLPEVVDRAAARLGWAPNRVAGAFHLLSLGARADFLHPPEGLVVTDVYPWRFNRALSLLRRPLLLRERDGGCEVLWGSRTIFAAQRYLIDILTDGRFRARSPALKTLMSEIGDDNGKGFERHVADLVSHIPDAVVRTGVTRVGRVPVRGSLQPIRKVVVMVK